MHFGQDHRAVERTPLQTGALILIAGRLGGYPCGVKDMSGKGAGLRLDRLALLPTDFKLSFDGLLTTFTCRLIWREGDFAGTAFQPASDEQAGH